MRISFFAAILALVANSVYAQSIMVSKQAWEGLIPEERSAIQKEHVVDVRDGISVGEIVDAQGIDESSQGTNGGAALGAAIGNAAYIDRSLKPDTNYSAKTQLAAILLGAAIGSALDRPPQAQYRFRYAIRTANREIEYREITQSEPFRHPPGVCIDLGTLEKIPQSACVIDSSLLREKYLKTNIKNNSEIAKPNSPSSATTRDEKKSQDAESTIQCKPKNLAAISTTREKCLIIEGDIL